MNWIKRKKLFSSIVVLSIGIGLLFCCGASFQTLLSAGNDMGHTTCGMTDMTGSSDSSQSQHNYMILASFAKLLNNFSLFFVAVLVSIFIVVKYDNFQFYLKNIRCKYGGFNLFNYLLRLFGLGILHPKTF